MDFEDVNRLAGFGFAGGVRVADLQVSCDSVPAERGVYLVARENTEPVRFLKASTGGRFKNKNPSVPVSVLEERWLPRSKVVYVGKAGGTANHATIQDRMYTFMQFGLGRPCGHWGGRYIWQLDDAKDLLVYWRSTPTQEPREVEKGLLSEFVQT